MTNDWFLWYFYFIELCYCLIYVTHNRWILLIVIIIIILIVCLLINLMGTHVTGLIYYNYMHKQLSCNNNHLYFILSWYAVLQKKYTGIYNYTKKHTLCFILSIDIVHFEYSLTTLNFPSHSLCYRSCQLGSGVSGGLDVEVEGDIPLLFKVTCVLGWNTRILLSGWIIALWDCST